MADRIAYDEEAAAAVCSVSLTTFKQWVRDGRIAPYWAGERASKPLYDAEELRDAVRSLPRTKGAAG